MHLQPARVGVGHQACGAAQAAGHQRDHQVGVHADGVGIAAHKVQPAGIGPRQVGIAAGITGQREVIGPAGGAEQLHQPDVGLAADVLQIADLEGLDVDRRLGAVAIAGMQDGQQFVLHARQALGIGEALEVAGVLGLGVDADAAAEPGRAGLGQVYHLLQRGQRRLVVVGIVGAAQIAQALLRADVGAQLGGGEILHPPATHLGAVQGLDLQPAGVLRQLPDIGAGVAAVEHRQAVGHPDAAVGGQLHPGQHRLVAGHQLAVLGHHQVGLDVVGALADGQRIAGQGVLGPVAGRTAVADHKGWGAAQRGGVGRLCRHTCQAAEGQPGGGPQPGPPIGTLEGLVHRVSWGFEGRPPGGHGTALPAQCGSGPPGPHPGSPA